tara:strand:+ start:1573 stop:1854 length:282 start_codon:yes stop_codon:yes gene_type:complete
MKNIELKLIEPITVGVSSRIKIGVDINNNYYIVKNIKSRIIMKDGKKINETANTITKKTNRNVFLATTAPVCSKTTNYLNDKKIKIIYNYTIS